MISKFYICKMGQGEWAWLHFDGVLTQGHTLVIMDHCCLWVFEFPIQGLRW